MKAINFINWKYIGLTGCLVASLLHHVGKKGGNQKQQVIRREYPCQATDPHCGIACPQVNAVQDHNDRPRQHCGGNGGKALVADHDQDHNAQKQSDNAQCIHLISSSFENGEPFPGTLPSAVKRFPVF